MFLFGILSSPLPYLLMAVFYFFGFATGMFKGNDDTEKIAQIQVKNIHIEPQAKISENTESTYQFQDYSFQKITTDYAVQPIQSSAISQKEKLIYFVHDIEVDTSPTSEYYFSRPPPYRS